jgi:hypothetical protein
MIAFGKKLVCGIIFIQSGKGSGDDHLSLANHADLRRNCDQGKVKVISPIL